MQLALRPLPSFCACIRDPRYPMALTCVVSETTLGTWRMLRFHLIGLLGDFRPDSFNIWKLQQPWNAACSMSFCLSVVMVLKIIVAASESPSSSAVVVIFVVSIIVVIVFIVIGVIIIIIITIIIIIVIVVVVVILSEIFVTRANLSIITCWRYAINEFMTDTGMNGVIVVIVLNT